MKKQTEATEIWTRIRRGNTHKTSKRREKNPSMAKVRKGQHVQSFKDIVTYRGKNHQKPRRPGGQREMLVKLRIIRVRPTVYTG